MYSQCPECLAIFKLAATSLAVAHGRVRCGSCAAEFDALANLSDDLPPEPVTELHRHAPGKPPMLAVPALRPQAPQRELFVSFEPGAPLRREIETDGTQRSPRDPAPSFALVRTARARLPRAGAGWLAGSLALFLLLAAQVAWLAHDTLLANETVRTTAQWVCERLSCELPVVRDHARITLLARDVRPHPSVGGALVISATLSNRGTFAQPFPTVEITLADPNEKLIAMRRFAPTEYVSDDATLRQGLAPGATSSLSFEVEDPGKNAVAFEFKFL